MKVLFFGDLAATGFGTVTRDLGLALIERGVDIRFVSQNEFEGLPDELASRALDLLSFFHVQPGDDPEGQGGVDMSQPVPDYIPRLVTGNDVANLTFATGEKWGEWKPDACILLGDFYGVRLLAAKAGLATFAGVPSFHYVPIEGDDLPPIWEHLWQVIRPVAMSAFGQREIAKVIGYEPPLAYHGVDTDTFRPVTMDNPITLKGDPNIVLASKARCKAFFFANPKVRVVLRCDRNMPRKNYPSLLRAMAPVMESRPDVVLALHCRSWDQGGDLHDSISKLPADVASRVLVPDLGSMPRQALAALYNSADLYVSTSAEGFGLTIAEALASGVPAVGIDYSAVPEVIGEAGTVVPVGQIRDNEYGHNWAVPDERAFGEAVAYLLDHPNKRRTVGAIGPRHVAERFTWGAAADVFIDTIGAALGVAVDGRSANLGTGRARLSESRRDDGFLRDDPSQLQHSGGLQSDPA